MSADPSYTPFAPARRVEPPATPLRAVLFRLVGVSNRPLRCATYTVATGIELRIEYEKDDDIVITQLFPDGNEERIAEKAAEWRAAFDGRGFRELAIV